MTFRRAVLLLIGIAAAGYAAAQTLPSQIVPLPDLSNSEGLKPDRERRPSPVHALSAADHDLLGRAFDAADRGDWIGAKSLAENTRGDIGKRLIAWRYVMD